MLTNPPSYRKPLPLISYVAAKLGRPKEPINTTANPALDPGDQEVITDPLAGILDRAQELDRRETAIPEKGQILRETLIKDAFFKYPFVSVIDTIEVIDRNGGAEPEERLLDRQAMVADHVMVKLPEEADEADLIAEIERLGFHVRGRLPTSGVFLVTSSPVDLDTVERLREGIFSGEVAVRHVTPDHLVHSNATTPTGPFFQYQWGLHNTGQTGGAADADIDAPEAWETSTGDAAVVVGVIDSGIDYNHVSLASNIWTNPGEIAGDGIDNDGNGYVDDVHGYDFANDDPDPMDDYFHGTHVSGTIGADPGLGEGVSGVVWKVSLMALKFLNANGQGYTSDAIEAVAYSVANGVNLTSNSWGGSYYNPLLYDEIAKARDHDMLFVAAAGNDGINTDVSPCYPACYDLDNIVAVASLDHNDARAEDSNYGATSVDLGAPGVRIASTVPLDGYAYASGTSMACPHVAGAAALLLSVDPTMDYAELKARLLERTDPVISLDGKTVTGGRLNLQRLLMADSGAEIEVDVTSIELDVVQGGIAGESFTMANLGTGDLEVALGEAPMPSWMHVSPLSGTVPVAGSMQVDVSLDSTGLEPGIYRDTIAIQTNDLDEFMVRVPVVLRVQLQNAALHEASSTGSITVPASGNAMGPANPYPSIVTVSGAVGQIVGIKVTLDGFSHAYPSDLTVLLEGPAGQTVMLMGRVGANIPMSNATLQFVHGTGASVLTAPLTSGTCLPSPGSWTGSIPGAPVGPHGYTLDTFIGSSPNGIWKLFLFDWFQLDHGSMDGWRLEFLTVEAMDTYDTWAWAQFGFGSANVDEGADEDGDSLNNLMEYALGLDPHADSSQGAPTLEFAAPLGGAMADTIGSAGKHLGLRVGRSARRTDLDYLVEVSSDLVNWTSGPGHIVTTEDSETALFAQDALSVGSSPRRFLRLRVERR